jgi:hypothetical protein
MRRFFSPKKPEVRDPAKAVTAAERQRIVDGVVTAKTAEDEKAAAAARLAKRPTLEGVALSVTMRAKLGLRDRDAA